MLLVQNYLLNFSSREEAISKLEDEYHISVKQYPDDIVVLNYNQIDSPRFNPLVDDCRGLILSHDFSKVLCRPYTRFYNFGEGGNKTSSFDFLNSYVYEKVDGSLTCVWYHDVKKLWCISTRKMGYAEGPTKIGNTYSQLFLKGIGLNKNTAPEEFSEIFENELSTVFPDKKKLHEITFIFELVAPEIRVVKKYNEAEVYLTGIRLNYEEKKSYVEIKPDSFKLEKLKIEFPKIYHMNKLNELMSSFNDLNPTDEGYVCFNPQTEERVKVKNPQYVAIHHLRDNGILSPKKIILLVLSGEYDEYITYFPEEKDTFDKYFEAYDKILHEINTTYDKIKNIERQKEFALEARNYYFSDILFKLRKDKKSLKEIINDLSEDRQVKLFSKSMEN